MVLLGDILRVAPTQASNNCFAILRMMGHTAAQSAKLWKHEFEITTVIHCNHTINRTHPAVFYIAVLNVCQWKTLSDINQKYIRGNLLYIRFPYICIL